MKSLDVLLLFAIAVLHFCLPVVGQDTVRFRQWLDAGVSPLQTLESATGGYPDLEVLRDMIGAQTVVALGEQTFGDAHATHARVRIARFLMEEMGFDRIVFENGIYDLYKADQDMRAGRADAAQALQNSLYPAWWEGAEFSGLTEYLQERLTAKNPVTVAGMDAFQAGTYAPERFVDGLSAFLEKTAPPGTFHDSTLAALDVMFGRMETWPQWPLYPIGPSLFPDKNLYTPLFESSADSARFFARSRDIFRRLRSVTGEHQAEANWWIRMYQNLELSVRMSEDIQNGRDFAARQARDSMMAENVRALMAPNPARKTIIWGSNYHFMKDISVVRYKPFAGAKPLAQRLAEKGIAVYSIATTAARGTYGQCNQTTRSQIFYASEKCLEFMLMKGEYDPVLVDFHADTTSLTFQMCVARYVPVKAPWYKVYDAVVFVKNEDPCALYVDNSPPERKSRTKKTIGIYGQVKEVSTNAHIAYAVIKLAGNEIGAISNTDGEFVLKIPEDKVTTGYIQINALGYEDAALQVANALNYDTLIIRLTPKDYGIQPIGISAKYKELTPTQVVRRAISRLDDNFQQDPLMMEVYYRRTRRDQSDTLYSEEAIMDLYDAHGNRRRGERALKNDRNYRINLIRRAGWEGWQGNMKVTLGELFRQDLSYRRHNVLSYRRLSSYTLEMEGVTVLDGNDVFVINYTCKNPTVYTSGEDQVNELSGKLYINAADFAVVRHDADLISDIRVSTAVAGHKYASLTRIRHLVYLYRSDGTHYCLRYAGQREIKSYEVEGHQQHEEYVSEIRLIKTELPGKKGFRGRWNDLDPPEARSDEKAWHTWMMNSLIDDWGLE